MIIICLCRSYKLPTLQEYVTNIPDWKIIEIERFNISNISISRIALKCNQMPPSSCDLVIESVIKDFQYCQECVKKGVFTILQRHNKSGYCAKHHNIYRRKQ